MEVVKNPGDLDCKFHAGQEVCLVMRGDDEILAAYHTYHAAKRVAMRWQGTRVVYATVTETGDFDKRIDD